MIYSIIGTQRIIREKALKEIALLGEPQHHLYSEHVNMLSSLIDASNLFGDTVVVCCISLGDDASAKQEMLRLLEQMEASKNIFIIDEPFGDVHLKNKLSKFSKKLYDAKEEVKKDTTLFALCDEFIKRNKKDAWILLRTIQQQEKGESIIGLLWWKFQLEWVKVREGKKSLFSLDDCERIGGAIIRASIKAHRGEADLMVEIEKIVLTV